jgi:hypothetical protein
LSERREHHRGARREDAEKTEFLKVFLSVLCGA